LVISFVAGSVGEAPAYAADLASATAEDAAGPTVDPSLSLDPAAPQVAALPGGVTPSYGQKPLSEGEWRFDFHGFLTAPLTIGLNNRANPLPGQNARVLHAPPVVPE